MTNQQILTKVIDKAIANGWQKGKLVGDKAHEYLAYYYSHRPPEMVTLIFNHDFAKALWGDHDRWCSCGYRLGMDDNPYGSEFEVKGWEHHLMQMVISPDPIKYLADNI